MSERPDIDRLAARARKNMKPDYRDRGDCPERAGVCWCSQNDSHAALDELVARANFADAYKYRQRAEAAEALADRNEELMRRAEAKRFSAETRAEAAEARVAELEAALMEADASFAEVEAAATRALADRDRLSRRVAELDAALRTIQNLRERWENATPEEPFDITESFWDAVSIADIALAGDGGGA